MNPKFVLIEYAPKRVIVARRIDNRPDEYVVWHITDSLLDAQVFVRKMNEASRSFEHLDAQLDSQLDLIDHAVDNAMNRTSLLDS